MRARRAVSSTALLAILLPLAALRAPANPSSQTQPLLDGCQRNNTMILALQTPEWVYVDKAGVLAERANGNPTSGRQTAEGVITQSRMAGSDLYVNHDFYDVNIGIDPDPAYEFLLPSHEIAAQNAPGGAQARLGTEWESAAVPLWAMPKIGDRARLSGNWIWDCGHWGNPGPEPFGVASQFIPYDPFSTAQDLVDDGKLEGEDTELHPLYEIAVFRKDAAGFLGKAKRATVLSRLDVWISGDGNPAHAEEECALLGIGFGAALSPACPRFRDVGGDYSYTLPVGPKPSLASKIVVNPVAVRAETNDDLEGIPVSVAPDAGAGTVRVSFSLPHAPVPQRFGISVEAGWTKAAEAVHHVVTLNSIQIVKSLDGASEPHDNAGDVRGEQAPDPGDWVLYANVSGHWQQIGGITQVTEQTITLNNVFDFYLPQGMTPRLFVGGRECDIPLLDCRLETYGATPNPASPFTEAGFNDNPGRIHAGGDGVPMTLGGPVTYAPALNPTSSGDEDLSNSVCSPDPCYRVSATWTQLS